MKQSSLVIVLVFLLGAVAGLVIAKKTTVNPNEYMDKSPEDAASALLNLGRSMAGNGSWQNIHLARVYFLSGKKDEGQAILDRVLDDDPKGGDWIRAGRLYFQAGEWDKAAVAFDKTITLAPKDEDWLAEIGAYYNLHGDREKAEELFQKSFSLGPSLNNVLTVAGSYVNVTPRKR